MTDESHRVGDLWVRSPLRVIEVSESTAQGADLTVVDATTGQGFHDPAGDLVFPAHLEANGYHRLARNDHLARDYQTVESLVDGAPEALEALRRIGEALGLFPEQPMELRIRTLPPSTKNLVVPEEHRGWPKVVPRIDYEPSEAEINQLADKQPTLCIRCEESPCQCCDVCKGPCQGH